MALCQVQHTLWVHMFMLAFITQNNGQNHVDNQGAILECMQRQQNIYTKYKLGTCSKSKVIYVTYIYTQCVMHVFDIQTLILTMHASMCMHTKTVWHQHHFVD